MLKLTHSDGTAQEITVALSAEEKALLEQYLAEYKELAASAALRRRPYPMEVVTDQERGPVIQAPLPSDEELIVLLHRLRPFILSDEPASYNRVSGILGRTLPSQPIRDVLGEERRRYDGRGWQKQLKISSGDTIINSDEIVMKWLNAYEYHRDTSKRADMAALLESSVPGLVEWVVIRMLLDKAIAIKHLGELVSIVLGTKQDLTFTVNAQEYSLANSGA